MKLDTWLLGFVLLFSVGSAANADEARQMNGPYHTFIYTPRPNESGVAKLDAVIRDMIAATVARDWERLSRHFTKRNNNFITELQQSWNVKDETSLFWGAMHKALSLRGDFYEREEIGRSYSTPQLNYPDEELERLYPQLDQAALEFFTVIDKDVAVKSSPDSAASTVEHVSYLQIYYLGYTDIIAKSANGLYYQWVEVLTPSGQKGFILSDKLYHFLNDYSASFSFEDGEWVLNYFLNG